MLDSCAIFHGKNMYPRRMKFIAQCSLWYDEAKKNMNSIVWHFSIGFPIYVIINPASLSFLHRMFYLLKCYEIYTVAYCGHVEVVVIFVE